MSQADRRLGEEMKRMYPLHALLPAPVRRRIRALKKIQLETIRLQAEFFLEVHNLEAKYLQLCGDLFVKRAGIVSGRTEPTDEDCDFDEGHESQEEEEDPAVGELRAKLSVTKELEAGAQGVPEFWLTCLKNSQLTSELICPHDEPILRHLIDVRVSMTTRESEPISFTLHFYFSPNPFFTRKVLTKEYEIKFSVDEESPWSFDGPEIVKTKGCSIDWQKGMDVTQKTIQKKQRHKTKSGQVRTVVKTVSNDSFFNFFNPPPMETQDFRNIGLLEIDFEIGSFIKEKLVPRAVLYYTGEALEYESWSEDYSSSSSSAEDSGSEVDEPSLPAGLEEGDKEPTKG